MSSTFPNGTIFSLGTTLDAAKVISAISNANPGVASSTAHGYTDGDIVLLAAASVRLDQRVVRVAGSVTNAFNLEGINTTDTSLYPSGFGVGSAREITAWTGISQVTEVNSEGGEQNFYRWTYLEDGLERQRPTSKSARQLSAVMDYDPALGWHDALLSADLAATPYALRAALPNGSRIYWSVYVGFDGQPSFNINENMQVRLSLSLANPLLTRYAS